MFLFTVISLIGAAVAVVMKERAKQLYITCGVLFSAGILLAGGFVHLLVDSNEQFAKLGIENFPWASAIAGMTILCLACIEIALDRGLDKYMDSHHKREAEDDNCSDTFTEDATISYTALNDQEVTVTVTGATHQEEEEDEHGHGHIHPENSFGAILMTLALSIHSIIEGLGIGAANDIADLQSAFIAIAFHKGFTAFALAEGMVSSGYWVDRRKRKYFYLSIGTFVFVTLLGIGIGWAISSSADDNALTAVLTSVTAGSFVYVSVFEILPEESRTVKRERLMLLPLMFFFLAGYCLMALLAIWV